jgi:branched-chain amino acid aminotransferase
MPGYFIFNGQFCKDGEMVISADNRSFRYGDGLFETMRVIDDSIALAEYHFERLFEGISKLQFECPSYFTAVFLAEEILSLCKKNKIEKAARVRLMVFRGNGGLYDPEDLKPNYLIQTWPLDQPGFGWNENGLVVDLYPSAQKSCDDFAALKSNNFLPYIMAALYAKQNRLDDSMVVNQYGRIADATIANIFSVKDGTIYTPPLSEGCVAGVMRRFLLVDIAAEGYTMKESQFQLNDLLEADELLLTNAVQGIRWVRQFRNKTYINNTGLELMREVNKKIR